MKRRTFFICQLLFALLCSGMLFAQDKTTIVAPTSEAAEGLDLKAVSEVFAEAENLEAFEKALNDPQSGINNLDLDDNGQVDYIRVVEQVDGDAHLIILQAALGKDEFQDVATIEVEKSGETANMQVRGNEVIYGPDYYYVPAHVHVHTWPVIVWMYRPHYRPWRSPFYFGYYPRWWKPWRPVHVNVYHKRVMPYRTRTTFTVSRKGHVKSVHRVKYTPRSTKMVKKKTTITRTKGPKGKKTTVTRTVKRKNPKTGKTTVRKQKVTVKKNNKGKRTVKGKRKTVKRK